MMILRRRGCLLSAWLLVCPVALSAAQPSERSTHSVVTGVAVHDQSGVPIAGVAVRLRPGDAVATTNSAGRFDIRDVPAGSYELTASVVGFILVRRTIEVSAAQVTDVIIAMAEGTGTYREAVTVRGELASKREAVVPVQEVIGSAALQNLRGVMLDDPLRAIQTLPGVSATDDLHSVFAVRGSDPAHLGFVVDGIPTRFLLHTVHAVDGGGSVSMINGDVLQSAALLTGGYPQRFGNRTGAQLELDLRDGSRDLRATRIGVSGSSVSAVAEGPMGRDRRGSWIVSGRKSYLDWLVSQVFDDPSFAFGFEDTHVKAVYDLTARHHVEWLTAAGRAVFTDRPEGAGANDLVDGHSTNWLSGVRWRFAPSTTTVLLQQVYGVGGGYRNINKSGIELDRGTSRELGYRGTFTYAPTSAFALDAGVQAERSDQSRVMRRQHLDDGAFEQDRQYVGAGRAWGAYGQVRWTPLSMFTVAPGVRIDRWATIARSDVSPWVGAEWRPTSTLRLTAATGVYRQAPRFEHLIGTSAGSRLRPERAAHYDAAVEQTMRAGLRWRVSAFRRHEADVLRARDAELRVERGRIVPPSATASFTNALAGTARGIELLVGRDRPNGLSGWLAYSASSVRYRDTLTGETFRGDFDAPHSVNAYLHWRVSDRTSVVAKFRAASNFPLAGYYEERELRLSPAATDPGAALPVVPSGGLPAFPRMTGYFLAAERNRVRAPFYSRLDVRANRTIPWATRRLTLFAEVTNVYNRTNVRSLGGDVNGLTGRVSNLTETLFPILPSVGVLFEF